MAASDSNDGQAPENFQIPSSDDGSENQLSIYVLKCSLCSKSRKNFHCRNCVQNGDFVHSTHNLSERFSEKQLRYFSLKTNLRKCNDRCVQVLQDRRLYENLKTEIQRKRKKVILLRNLIGDLKVQVNSNIKYKESLANNNRLRTSILPKYEDKVKKLEDYVGDRIQQNKKLEEQKMELLIEVKGTIRSDINKLLKYIFPTTQTTIKREYSDKSNITEKEMYSHGISAPNLSTKISLEDNFNESEYVIVAPSLPANGNYSAYIDWITHNKDGVPSSASNETLPSANPAYRISAALTFATQLLNLLSFYLDIRLPHKLAYSDFCKQELSEQQFMKKVARLNLNVLYLCYTQRVPLELLNPNHTLENMLKLLDTTVSDLGHIGPVEPSNATLTCSIDTPIMPDFDVGTEYESDEDHSFRQEWEAVSHLSPLDTGIPMSAGNTQQAVSMAGGLVTSAAASIASIWRGWTTGR